MDDEITKLICEAYREAIDLQGVKLGESEKVGEDTLIYDSEGYLDSLGLVSFLAAVEQKVQEKFNASISIVTEEAVSKGKSSLRDIKSLSSYVKQLLKQKGR